MEPRSSQSKKTSMNCFQLNGSHILREFCQSQTSTRSRRKKSSKKMQSQRDFSSSERLQETIVPSSRWWDNKWQLKSHLTNILKRLTPTNTKTFSWNKLLRLRRSFRHSKIHLLVHKMLPLPRRTPKEQEFKAIIPERIKKQRKPLLQTGDKANSMTTTTKISMLQSKHRSRLHLQLPHWRWRKQP